MLQFIVHQFCLAKVRKMAQKALGDTQNVGAEGRSLNPSKELLLNLWLIFTENPSDHGTP